MDDKCHIMIVEVLGDIGGDLEGGGDLGTENGEAKDFKT
jgi:hypothetical protein